MPVSQGQARVDCPLHEIGAAMTRLFSSLHDRPACRMRRPLGARPALSVMPSANALTRLADTNLDTSGSCRCDGSHRIFDQLRSILQTFNTDLLVSQY
jgi:hypothetical protein